MQASLAPAGLQAPGCQTGPSRENQAVEDDLNNTPRSGKSVLRDTFSKGDIGIQSVLFFKRVGYLDMP